VSDFSLSFFEQKEMDQQKKKKKKQIFKIIPKFNKNALICNKY
jgi:hypothetical protein